MSRQRKPRKTRRQIEIEKKEFYPSPRAVERGKTGRPETSTYARIVGTILIEDAKTACQDDVSPKKLAAKLVRRRFPPELQDQNAVDRMLRWLRDPSRSAIPGTEKLISRREAKLRQQVSE